MRTFSKLFVAGILALTLFGSTAASCKGTVSPSPTSTEVQQTRAIGLKVINAIKQTALALRAVQDLEIDLHSQGVINDTDHQKAQRVFLTTFQVLDTALVQVGQATTQPQLRTTLELVKTNLTSLSDALVTSNPNASKALKQAAVAVTLALDIAFALIGA
jgi:hypothetical protein